MSDELTVRLRELAESVEAPPPGSGAEIRATAGRRRRRRRTTAAVAGGCVAAGMAAVLTLNVASHGSEQHPPTASRTTQSATRAVPDATVDLSRRVLTVAGRELPVSTGTARTPTPTGLMTVTLKRGSKVVPATTVGLGLGDEYDLKLSWVLELTPIDKTTGRAGAEAAEAPAEATAEAPTEVAAETAEAPEATDGTDGTGPTEDTSLSPSPSPTPSLGPAANAIWIAALTYNEKAPGAHDTTSGWIGLRSTDAQWLYRRLSEGALVEIRGTAPTAPATDPVPTPGLG
ncbi:L,D-transpeptidase [Streptomyces phaeolivaceus]|uniref:L,D-transpeptidase n=1 Tax=Streptomyces phaeolivaceus TaxID=2653200 RepID=A0A5P8K728_9ACTN|nr:L,D-transpeptidase [Streptomyces phaeolivaceus]QFQ98854.1 L,D-transpeptidase [Streptomyces phaeolivaceus]